MNEGKRVSSFPSPSLPFSHCFPLRVDLGLSKPALDSVLMEVLGLDTPVVEKGLLGEGGDGGYCSGERMAFIGTNGGGNQDLERQGPCHTQPGKDLRGDGVWTL